ncbi:MAG TPA: DUF3224 domain-containing protein [Actinophytocola sp.]|jgi:Protein of unknown function (DUF3224)|uniref:DUF3224 domain-containing protein n=1 Tax=Actinophytocola sp. TaxID=1872138 RepID=UPI002DC01721|nr:DUF3224 domain-containing protein [Actinophytocola sp.]HEU5471463.1 DUF3224 domain-containing protein [Actinophytocola sp.]
MSTKLVASGTFEIGEWDEEVFDDGAGARLGRTRLTKTFAGDLEATSVVHMLAVSVPVDGDLQGVAYVAVERVTGTLGGRTGGFVLTHVAGEAHGMKVAVVPGSGTGDLRGITGECTLVRHANGSHTYAFDYAY